MHKRLFLIGGLARLPDPVVAAISPRLVDRLDQAEAVVAVSPPEGRWPNDGWDHLRQAHQDYRLAVHGTLMDAEGGSRRPPKPWPGSDWCRPRTQAGVVWYRLETDPGGYDPGDATIFFPSSKHRGKRIGDCPVSYLDWLLGQDWFDPGSFLHRMVRLYLGKLSRDQLLHLDREPFDVRGFIPSERWATVGVRLLRRPPDAAWIEDEEFDQQHPDVLRRHEGLERRAKDRVLRAAVYDPEAGRIRRLVRGNDPPARVHRWDWALEAIDRIEAAGDLDQLDHFYDQALAWLKVLTKAERGGHLHTLLKEEIDQAYRQCKERLEEDSEPDFQGPRVAEAVRRLRGCITLAELEEEAAAIRRHTEDFTAESLATLRRWFSHFRADIVQRNIKELEEKYGHPQTAGV